MLIKFILKQIFKLLLCVYRKLAVGCAALITSHTKAVIGVVVALLLSLLCLKHCKFGIFIACKDYTYNNNFSKPCQLVQVLRPQKIIREEKK